VVYDSYPTTAAEWNATCSPASRELRQECREALLRIRRTRLPAAPPYDSLATVELNALIDTPTSSRLVMSQVHTHRKVETLTYPDNFATKNVYNGFGYLSEVRNNADNTPFLE